MKIRLLGRPEIRDDDGRLCEVRGHQAWAVLALLALSERPLGRREIASQLFPEVDDPLGALRWCLAALRRALGRERLSGDPVELNLPTDADIDVWRLFRGDLEPEEAGELLDGTEISASLEFSTWLLIERERISALVYEKLRQQALRALSSGNYSRAALTAELLIRRRPLDETGHVLLVKSLTLAGQVGAASEHIAATEREFLSQLGEKPSPALRSAARRTIASAPEGISGTAIVEARIKAGVAALTAGAVDAGIDSLRRAAEGAEATRDTYLRARALVELGGALVHSIRGYDDEGAILLRQAVDLANECGSAEVACSGLRELGYVDALAGRRPSAAKVLDEALQCSNSDDQNRAGVHAVIGFNLVDWGKYEDGLSHFEEALELARSTGNLRREIWSLGIGGWGHLRAGHSHVAVEWLQRCVEKCEQASWIAFRPWPVAILAEASMQLEDRVREPRHAVEEAFALSCELGDPCWEAATARSIALASKVAGDLDSAHSWLVTARERCTRVSDLYAALLVNIVTDQMELSAATGDREKAHHLAREVLSLASRTHSDAHLRIALDVLGIDVST